jgi:hypothetical protein
MTKKDKIRLTLVFSGLVLLAGTAIVALRKEKPVYSAICNGNGLPSFGIAEAVDLEIVPGVIRFTDALNNEKIVLSGFGCIFSRRN